MGRAASSVDVAAVGLVGNDLDHCPEPTENLGRGLVGGAVGAVEEDAAAGQVEIGKPHMQLTQVILERAMEAAHAADPLRWLERLFQLGLDRCSVSSSSLKPSARTA